jgi:hypothetical protein
MALSIFPRVLLLVEVQFGFVTSALTEPSKLTGEALRQVVSGRTVLLETPIGSFPIRYRRDGTMTGQAPAFIASLGTEKDRGHAGSPTTAFASWYRWLDAKQYCLSCKRWVPPSGHRDNRALECQR